MMLILMIVLAIIGGAALSVQAALNGRLGGNVGVFKSAFLTFSVGALVTRPLAKVAKGIKIRRHS